MSKLKIMELAQVSIETLYPPAKITDFQTLGGFVSSFLPKVLIFAGIIFFFLTVISGLGVIAGAGSQDAHAKEKSKSYFTYALIGLGIIFTSYWIVQIISFVTFNSLKGLI